MANTNKIRKIKLSNGQVYSIFDEGALRLNDEGKLVTGNIVVDDILINTSATIASIDELPLAQTDMKVLVRNKTTGVIGYQDVRQVLKSLGVITAQVQDEILNLEVVDIPNAE